MARRTRRPTVVWLPNDVTNRIQLGGAATAGAENGGFQLAFLVSSGGALTGHTAVIPVVKDEPQNVTGTTETLSDLEGSAYRLRRIVGKIFVQPAQISAAAVAGTSFSFMVTAGFIILRVDDSGAILAANADAYNPQALDAVRDPWIWRRSWVVSNVAGIATANLGVPDSVQLIWPESNVQGYGGGVLDGPHIDAKTARIVSDEERLFLAVSAVGLDGTNQGDDTVMQVFGEVRVLASMRKQSGNRRNASR